MTTSDKPRLRRCEASSYLHDKHGVTVAVATLSKLASVGGGPVFNKFGRAVLYDVAALDAWALARLGAPRASTSAAA